MIRGMKGFTLIEMAIGILLTGVILSASFSIYLTQHKQLLVQDEISDLQSNVRAATAELATRIRMAGYGLPNSIRAIQAYDTNPDSIAIAYASNELNGIHLEQSMPEASAILRCDGHDLSNIRENDWLYIVDPFLNTGEYFLVSAVDYSASCIQHNTSVLSHAYPAGSNVLKLLHFKYYIDMPDSGHPNLMCQVNNEIAQIFAENITDIQFRYGLSSSVVVDMPVNEEMIREILITVSARSFNSDPEFLNQYRTRTSETRVKVRNLGINYVRE